MSKLSFRIEADYQKVQRLREEISKLKQEIGNTNAIQNPTAFNNLNNKLQQTSKELGNVTGKIAQASATMETDFRKKIYDASQGVNAFTEKIIAQKAVVKDVEADVRRLGEEYRKAVKYSPMSADSKLSEWTAARKALGEEKAALFGLTQEQATARLSVKKLRDEYALLKEEGGGTAQTMDLLSSKMKGIAATVMGGIGLKELASRIISVRAEFESMETSLKVLLGGNQQRLDSIMKQIKEYALASPLNTKDMVGAVQMMTSFGIEAEKSIDYLKAIGDISMGDTGKFNSLALAFSQMSSAGKLMGQDLLQMVNAGFNPLEEISRKTGKSIGELKEEMSKGAITSKMVQDAFISVTSAGGKFYGMSAEGAKTLNGQISMLQESFDNMFNELGSKGEGVVMSAVKGLTSLVDNYENVGKILAGIVSVYGVYRTAVIVNTLATSGWTAAAEKDIVVKGLQATWTSILEAKTKLLNSALLANPYVLITTLVAAVVAGYITYNSVMDDAAKTQRDINQIKDDAAIKLEKEKAKIEELQKAAKDETLSMKDRLTAIKQLNDIIPNYNAHLDATTGKYIENKQALDAYLSSLVKKYEIEGAKKMLAGLGEEASKARVKLAKANELAKSASKAGSGVSYTTSWGSVGNTAVDVRSYANAKLQDAKDEVSRIKKEQDDIKKAFGIDIFTESGEGTSQGEAHNHDPKKKGKVGAHSDNTPKQVDYDKMALDQSEAEKELAYKVSQSRIDAEEDAAKRERMQRAFNHEKELDDIEKQKNDLIQKHIANAKEIFEADPKNKDKKFDGTKITLTEAEQKQYDEIRANTIQKQQRENADYQNQQIEALNAYLKEYGSFEEKKLAITQEYEEKIRKAGSIGEKATLEMQRDKEIETAKNEGLQNAIDWNGVFSDLQGHTKQYLQGLRSQLQDLLNAGNLPIDQMQTVSEKINAIDDELGKQQGIWDFVGERTREHNRLLKEAADAQERLNVAKSEEVGANVNLGFAKMDVQKRLSDAGVKMNIGDISTANLNGKIDLTDEKFKGMVPLLQKLAVAEGKLTEARKKVTDATNKAKQAKDGAKEKTADAISRWFDDKLDFIRDKGIDQIPGLLGSVGLGSASDKVQKGLDGFNSAAGAAADFASGNYIGAAFKGISAIKSFGSALGIGAGNAAEVNRTTERLMESNEHLAERIDDLSDIIGDSAGAKAVNAYDTALKAQEEINNNNMEILKAQMGYHSAHHSNAYYSDENKIASYNNDAQLAFKSAGVTASTINGLDSIYNLTPEQLKAIKDFAPDLWRYLTEVGKYDKSEYWDDVVEQAGKTQKLTKQIQDNLTQTSFDSLRSGFLDTLMDMDSDAEDWSTNFSKMLFKSIVNNSVLGDEFDGWLKAFQEKWSEKIKSGNMSKQDYANYRKEYDSKMQELKTQTNNLASAVGYDGTSSSQNATANGISNISYDQADNLTGIMTSIQIAGEQRNAKLDTVGAQMTLMNTRVDDIRVSQIQIKDIANDTRDILANSYMELKEINVNTGNSEKHLKEMKSDISDMKRIIKDKL